MADPVVGSDRPQRLAGGMPCDDRCLGLGADFGGRGHGLSLPMKVARLGGEGCQAVGERFWRPGQQSPLGNLPPPRQPSIGATARPVFAPVGGPLERAGKNAPQLSRDGDRVNRPNHPAQADRRRLPKPFLHDSRCPHKQQKRPW